MSQSPARAWDPLQDLLAFKRFQGCENLLIRRPHAGVGVRVFPGHAAAPVDHKHRRVRNNVTAGVRCILEQLRIELTIAVYDAVIRICKQREIGRATLLPSLAFHHLASAFNVIRTKSEDLGGFFQTIVE